MMKLPYIVVPKFSREDVIIWGIGSASLLLIVSAAIAGYLLYETAIKKQEVVLPTTSSELLSPSQIDDAIRILDARQSSLNTLLGK